MTSKRHNDLQELSNITEFGNSLLHPLGQGGFGHQVKFFPVDNQIMGALLQIFEKIPEMLVDNRKGLIGVFDKSQSALIKTGGNTVDVTELRLIPVNPQ
jgi:hypothetical protein